MSRVPRCSLLVAAEIYARVTSGTVLPVWPSIYCRNFHSSGTRPDRRRKDYSTGAAAAAEVEGGVAGALRRFPGWDLAGAAEYLDYRRSLYGEITHKALLVDAVGTLVVPSQPMAQIYRQIGEKYGVKYSEDEILDRYRWAYQQPWGRSRLRYVNDGRPFWQYIVSSSTGCSDMDYFEELYKYYMTEKAWHLCDLDAENVFKALRKVGVKTAVVSNFDTRLRPLLQALKCDNWFDAVAVSAEVAAEKPNPTIFLKACELLGVKPEEAVHVGDDRRNDIWGARDAGCDAWLWGSDVDSFKEFPVLSNLLLYRLPRELEFKFDTGFNPVLSLLFDVKPVTGMCLKGYSEMLEIMRKSVNPVGGYLLQNMYVTNLFQAILGLLNAIFDRGYASDAIVLLNKREAHANAPILQVLPS